MLGGATEQISCAQLGLISSELVQSGWPTPFTQAQVHDADTFDAKVQNKNTVKNIVRI
jgi:hypothetical protein